MEGKKNVPLLKLIQYPWSIKTVNSQFQCDPFPKSLDLPGYDTSHPIAHTQTGRKKRRRLNMIFSRLMYHCCGLVSTSSTPVDRCWCFLSGIVYC